MKKGLVLFVFLIGVTLLISSIPIVSAQTYSGFNRFADNVKLFFSSGDNKVKLALEIREKEINSAIVNAKDNNDKEVSNNLKNAWKKLQIVQEKVSLNVAEEVISSSFQIRERIVQEGNLSKDFEVYALEEEKTGLTAEWVVESNGKEGQTLQREVVYDVGGERVVKIENRIDEIDNEIAEWVVKNDVVGDVGSSGLTREVKTEIANGDNGLKPEVKTYVAGADKNEATTEPDLNTVNPDLYDSDARAPGDTIDETYDDDETDGPDGYAEGTTAEGTNTLAP